MTSLLLASLFLACGPRCADVQVDFDGDGFAAATPECRGPVPEVVDCDDGDPDVHPGAEDRCNGLDDDCDGVVDPNAALRFVDRDLDGWGEGEGFPICGSDITSGLVGQGGDCDDADASVFPGAVEACNGIDDDCDGVTDPDLPMPGTSLVWADADGDGAGDPLTRGTRCGAVEGWVSTFDDCDDTVAGRLCAASPPGRERSLDGAPRRLVLFFPQRVHVTPDVTGDGLGEVAVSGTDGTVYLHSGAPAGEVDVIAAAASWWDTDDTSPVVRSVGDLDGDGDADVVMSMADGLAAMAAPLPPGPLDVGAALWTATGPWRDVRPADGAAVWAVYDSGTARLIGADGALEVVITGGVDAAASPDLDGDGVRELVLGATPIAVAERGQDPFEAGPFDDAGVVWVLSAPFFDGDGAVLAEASFLGDDLSSQLGVGLDAGSDLDGDGLPDVLGGTGTVYAALLSRPAGDGPVVEAATTLFVGDAGWLPVVAAADVDGDGAADALIGGYPPDADGQLRPQVFVAYGPIPPGTIATASLDRWGGPQGLELPGVGAGDLDADGVAEIAVGIPSESLVYVVAAP